MLICDLHCDLPYKIYAENKSLFSKDTQWSLNKLNKNNNYIQFFAAFTDKMRYDNPFKTADEIIDKFIQICKDNDYISIVYNKEQFEAALSLNKTIAVLSIEGGEALGGEIENLDYFYNKGVRCLTLTWNYPNQLGEGVWCNSSNSGLTLFGKKVLKETEKLRMIIDVSHLTEKGFYDVAEYYTKPFCATHSNSYTICRNKRNLTDCQFKEIVKRNGLVGINFYPEFLNNSQNADVFDVIKHIEHFMSLGGENTLALGSDFDGIDCTLRDIKDIACVEILANELLKINYTEKIVANLFGNNVKKYIISNIF